MSDPICVRCGRPLADGAYACDRCAYRAGDQLHELADMAPAARDVAQRQTNSGGGGSSGKPGSQIPFDPHATQALNDTQEVLTARIDQIAVERGTTRPWFTTNGEPIAVAALWLAGHVEWVRHKPWVDDFITDIGAAHRVIRGIARGPAEQKYLGACGAVLAATAEPCPGACSCQAGPRTALSAACTACSCFTACHPTIATGAEGQTCDGDVYAYRGAKVGRCRTCGAEVATSEREAWLDAEVRAHAFRDREIADAYGVNVKTIRTWVGRGHLVPHGHDADGRPLLNVGDVLDLAAADAARRETDRAKRARRRDTKTEEDAA